MADRSTYNGSSSPMPTGIQFLDQYADRLGQLFDASVLPLTAVGGSANAVTATLDPPLSAGLVAGMKVSLTWVAANTGGVTLKLNGGSAVPVLDASGVALASCALAAGRRDLLEHVGGSWRVLTGSANAGGTGGHFWTFTASGTLTIPTSLDDDLVLHAILWGGGGGGGKGTGGSTAGGGGGGGFCATGRFRLGSLPSRTLSVTIAAGGGSESDGGTSSLGSLLAAYGGRKGLNYSGADGAGGRGGGMDASGTGGGTGGAGSAGAPAAWDTGGGGGGSGGESGGSSFRGGGGGGGSNSGSAMGSGGQSVHGGNGGNATNGTGVAGAARGGGGGGGRSAGGAGGRGEAWFWIG